MDLKTEMWNCEKWNSCSELLLQYIFLQPFCQVYWEVAQFNNE